MVRAPSTSGFHMKGNAYRSLQEYVEAWLPGGNAALAGHLSKPVRAFFEQAFIAGGWYDVLPIDEITRTMARLLGLPHEELCKRFGQATLDRDKGGIYRGLLKLASPDLLVRSLPYTTKRYFDFVSLDVKNVDKRSYRVTVTGIPEPIAVAYVYITTVFIVRAIEGAGGKNVVSRSTAPHVTSTINGISVCSFERHLNWDG